MSEGEREREGKRERENTQRLEGQRDWTGLTSIEINRAGEPKFRAWMYERTTRTSKPLYYEEARDAGAEIAGVNPKTTPGWIQKLTSTAGDFKIAYPVVDGKVKREILFKHSLLEQKQRRFYERKYKG